MTDSCPSWQQKPQKSSSSKTWLWSASSSGLSSASLRVRKIIFLWCENHLECSWVSPHRLMSSVSSLSSGSVGQSVVLTQPAAKSVQLGQAVSINCKANKPADTCCSPPKHYLAWYHQKSGETPKSLIYRVSHRFSGISSRFSGSGAGNGVDFTLTISGVQSEDAGVYYCQAAHYINSQWTLTQCKIIVQKPPSVWLKANWTEYCSWELQQRLKQFTAHAHTEQINKYNVCIVLLFNVINL